MAQSHDVTSADGSGRSPRRIALWVGIGLVAVVALVYGGILFYVNVINDAPDALDEDDLSAALGGDTTPTTESATAPATDAAGTTPIATSAPATSQATTAADNFDGDWAPVPADSEFGYRVPETLAGVDSEAVGRGDDIEGLLTIAGTTATVVDVTVQVESITSDDSLRDEQFRGRIMNVSEFPTASFRITEPIEFGTIPTGDDTITATATGELTLRGVTNPVTFDVTAQTTGERIGVLGSIPVAFTDYEIPDPSVGPVRLGNEGEVEFVLVFERAS